MRIELAAIEGCPGHPATTLLIDGVLAVDAGVLGLNRRVEELAAVRHVLLTHSHHDHIAGLPIFLDTIYGYDDTPPTIHASTTTLAALRAYIFNNQIMPDFVGMSDVMKPFLKLNAISANAPLELDGYRVTPFAVDHNVPTLGFVVEDTAGSAIAVVTDTLPIDWSAILALPNLKAVFLEASFPDRFTELALVSKHHTVSQFLAAASLFPPQVRVIPMHLKPRFADELLATILAANLPNVAIPPDGIVEV